MLPVFDEFNNLMFLELESVYSIFKDPSSRKIVVTSELGLFYMPSTIEQIDIIMSKRNFVQIDKNRIINVAQIKQYDNLTGIIEVDGERYTVSTRRRRRIDKIIEKRSRNANDAGQN